MEEKQALCLSCRHAKLFHSSILHETFMVCTKDMLDESFVDLKKIENCKKFRPRCKYCAFDRKFGLFHKCILSQKKNACTCYTPMIGYENALELDDDEMLRIADDIDKEGIALSKED